MFRIDMREIQGHITKYGQFSAELTDLAEVIVEAAYQLEAKNLRSKFGLPQLKNGRECAISICALGKCGLVRSGVLFFQLVQFFGPIGRYFAETALYDLYGVAELRFCR